jgi:hypothetical protein
MSSYDAAVVDTAMLEHPDLIRLSRGVRLMYLEALVWSKLHRTDGQIPKHMLRRISDEADVESAARSLVEVQRWEDDGDEWSIVDYLTTQMSAARVARRQETARVRFDRWSAGSSNDVANDVANDSARPAPPRPKRAGGGGAGGGSRGRAEPGAPTPGRPGDIPPLDGPDNATPCSRCGVMLDTDEMEWPSQSDRDLDKPFCPTCLRYAKEHGRIGGNHDDGICLALKKNGEPCSVRVATAEDFNPWCSLYHGAASKRGINPQIGQPYLNKHRAEVQAEWAAAEANG